MVKKTFIFIGSFLAIALFFAAASLTTAYFILKHDVTQKIKGQERASTLIAEQIQSANLNSILAFTDQYYIFILHQRDGRILFESAQRSGDALRLWEENKIALKKELLEKRTGGLRYPPRQAWEFLSPQMNVVYLYLPELDWIVATELPAAVSLDRLWGVYSPVVWAALAGFSLLFAWYLSFFRKKETVIAFANHAEPPPRPREAVKSVEAPEALPPVQVPEKIHPVHTSEYTQRLVLAAQKALEGDLAMPVKPAEPVEERIEEVQQVMEETEIKDHFKDVSQKLQQEMAAPAEPPAASPEETRKAAEIYFERMMSEKKTKKEKPKPASIIGMALSKKKNREEFGD